MLGNQKAGKVRSYNFGHIILSKYLTKTPQGISMKFYRYVLWVILYQFLQFMLIDLLKNMAASGAFLPYGYNANFKNLLRTS